MRERLRLAFYSWPCGIDVWFGLVLFTFLVLFLFKTAEVGRAGEVQTITRRVGCRYNHRA